MMKTIGAIVVVLVTTAGAAGLRDTVTLSPAQPSAKQSFTLDLYDADGCCCSAIYYDTLAIIENQTDIMLRYEADEAPCTACRCLVAGNHITFKATPIKAGTYTIYKHKFMYCPPNTPCPLIYPEPIRVGQVTIASASTSVTRQLSATTSMADGPTLLDARSYSIKGELALPASATGIRITGASSITSKTVIVR